MSNIKPKKSFGAPANLRLVLVSDLVIYAPANGVVRIRTRNDDWTFGETPGTVTPACEQEGTGWRIKITAKIRGFVRNSVADVEALVGEDVVAIFTDHDGQERIAGSPDTPLNVKRLLEDGGVTLSVEGLCTDIPRPCVTL